MSKLYVIPQNGLAVLHPETAKPLPAEGQLVEKSPYWLRRLKDGSVKEDAKRSTKEAKADSSSKTSKTSGE